MFDDDDDVSVRESLEALIRVAGLSNKQVGFELGIGEITEKAHRGKAMQKMQADSLADLVRMSEVLHLVSAPKG